MNQKLNTLNFKTYGEGEPIIILHGLLGMLDNWHSFSKKLSHEYRIISVDQRNHGKSFHSDEFSLSLLAKDIDALMSELNIEQATIIGHSMGGKTVMQLLSDIPYRIDKAIIIDISPREYQRGHDNIFKALMSLDLNNLTSRQQATEQLLKSLSDLGVVQFLLKNLQRDADNTFKWKANVNALYENYETILSNPLEDKYITTPTLFVAGSKSNYIQEEDHDIIHSIFVSATIEVVQEAGHWIHAEKPNELLKIVKDYLS